MSGGGRHWIRGTVTHSCASVISAQLQDTQSYILVYGELFPRYSETMNKYVALYSGLDVFESVSTKPILQYSRPARFTTSEP